MHVQRSSPRQNKTAAKRCPGERDDKDGRPRHWTALTNDCGKLPYATAVQRSTASNFLHGLQNLLRAASATLFLWSRKFVFTPRTFFAQSLTIMSSFLLRDTRAGEVRDALGQARLHAARHRKQPSFHISHKELPIQAWRCDLHSARQAAQR